MIPTPSGSFRAASSAPCRSATTSRAPSAARPCAIAFPMPCAPPVTIATLPLEEGTVSGCGEKERREQDPVLLREDERLHLRDVGLPALVADAAPRGGASARRGSRSPTCGRWGSASPISLEKKPIRLPRIGTLDRQALLLVEAKVLGHLPDVERVDREPRRSRPGQAVPATRCRPSRILQLEPLLDSVLRALAADSGLLDAAEGRDLGRDEAGVDADDAGLQRLADPPDPTDVAGVEVGRRARTACRWRSAPPPPRPRRE